MYKCKKCGEETRNGYYTYAGEFLCKQCYGMEPWHTDRFTIEERLVVRQSPYTGLSEEVQRGKFIEFAYNLFDGLHPRAYALIKSYRKKYDWIVMTRALEYFYLVKKNDRKKAKKSIGIIPYIFEEAMLFYERENNKIEVQMEAFIKAVDLQENVETKSFEIKSEKQTSNKQINLDDL